jgi:competence transcription factor ComK
MSRVLYLTQSDPSEKGGISMFNKYNELIPSAVWVLMVIVAAISASDFRKSKVDFSNINIARDANNMDQDFSR